MAAAEKDGMAGEENHTQSAIVAELQRAGGRLRIAALARAIEVSEETVRRNIRRLAALGLVEKLHGAAVLSKTAVEDDFQHRLRVNPEAKRRIAHAVAAAIPPGASLFLDVGSTTAFIADALRAHRALMVVTNSVSVAQKLATRNDNRVFMAGGELRAHDGGAFGAEAIAFAGHFRADYAILSAAAIDPRRGLMLHDLEEAAFSRAILGNAATRIVAADSSKFGASAPIAVCPPSELDRIFTEAPPPEAFRAALADWGCDLVLAP